MCDVCIIRQRIYSTLPEQEQEACDQLAASWQPKLDALRSDPEAFGDAMILYGESLDILLGRVPAFTASDLAEMGDLTTGPLPPRHSSHPHYQSDRERRPLWRRIVRR